MQYVLRSLIEVYNSVAHVCPFNAYLAVCLHRNNAGHPIRQETLPQWSPFSSKIKQVVELPDKIWSILKGIFIQDSKDLDRSRGAQNWTFRPMSFGDLVWFGSLDCSQPANIHLCYHYQSHSIWDFDWRYILIHISFRAPLFVFGELYHLVLLSSISETENVFMLTFHQVNKLEFRKQGYPQLCILAIIEHTGQWTSDTTDIALVFDKPTDNSGIW